MQQWKRTFSFAARPKRFPSFVNVTHDGSVLLPSSMRMVLTLPFSQYPIQLHTTQTGLYVTGCHDTVQLCTHAGRSGTHLYVVPRSMPSGGAPSDMVDPERVGGAK